MFKKEEKVVPSAVAGFRLFQIALRPEEDQNFILKSLYQSSSWEKGENKALCIPNNISYFNSDRNKTRCYVSGSDEVPEKDCYCGLQAYYELDLDLVIEPSFFDSYAIASVAGAGKVLMHRHGFRSEKSQITGLFIPDYREILSKKDFQEVRSRQLKIASFYGIRIFQTKESFLQNAKKYGQLINPKKDQTFMPKRGDFIRSRYGLTSIDDEIEIHGGDCSLKILNSITDSKYQFDDYPRSLLVKKSLFRSFSWSMGARKRRLKGIDNTFYKKSSQLIKKSTSKTTLRVAKFFDSPKQYLLLGLIVLGMSTLLNFNNFSFLPEFIQSFTVVFVFIFTIYLFRFLRKRIRKKLIQPVNKKIQSQN